MTEKTESPAPKGKAPLRRLPAALAALLLLGAAGPSFSAAEWNVLERETPRFDAAAGSAAGRAAACGEDHAEARQRHFYDFILRYLNADAAAKQLERFELARAPRSACRATAICCGATWRGRSRRGSGSSRSCVTMALERRSPAREGLASGRLAGGS